MAQGRRNNFANYSEATPGRIAGLTEQDLSAREVAQQVGCNIKTVELWRRKFRELGPDGLKDHRKQNKRPKKMTPEQDTQILLRKILFEQQNTCFLKSTSLLD